MDDRPMTPDEMRDFEENVLHHREEETNPAVPASEPEVGRRIEQKAPSIPVPPAAD